MREKTSAVTESDTSGCDPVEDLEVWARLQSLSAACLGFCNNPVVVALRSAQAQFASTDRSELMRVSPGVR